MRSCDQPPRPTLPPTQSPNSSAVKEQMQTVVGFPSRRLFSACRLPFFEDVFSRTRKFDLASVLFVPRVGRGGVGVGDQAPRQ